MKIQEQISVKDYQRIRRSVEWKEITDDQAERSLKNSAYVVSCIEDEQIIGTARVIWDGGYVAFIVDVMVVPEYQRKGAGSMMLSSIIEYLKSLLNKNEKMMINLYAAQGKEPFYWKHGFILGSGMFQWL